MLGSILRRREAKAIKVAFIIVLVILFIFLIRYTFEPLQSIRSFKTSTNVQSSSTDPVDTCPPHPGSADVLVIIKTGATEASARIPLILSTFAQCIPNVVIFSDLAQQLDGRMIHDALESVSAEYHTTSSEFEFYRRIREIHQAFGDVTAFGKLEGNSDKAWILDKWKNIPILHKAYQMYPNVKWYVCIDADTFLGFHNLLNTLEKLNHTFPLYIGAANTYYADDFIFAYGGAGYIVSAGAAALFEEAYSEDNVKKWEAHTNVICCGDVMLGMAMKDAGVRLRNAAPLMQPTPIGALEWNSRLWCEPSWTWHHVDALEMMHLSEFDREWHKTTQAPYRFKDLFRTFIEPGLVSMKDDWDNLSSDRVFVNPGGADIADGYERNQQRSDMNQTLWDDASPGQRNSVMSPSHCEAACLEDQWCVQWTWKAGGSCGHHWSLRLGYQSVIRDSRVSKTKPDIPVVNIAVYGICQHLVASKNLPWNEPFPIKEPTNAYPARAQANSHLPSPRSFHALMVAFSCYLLLVFPFRVLSIMLGLLYILLQTCVFVLLRGRDGASTEPYSLPSSLLQPAALLFLLWSAYNLYTATTPHFDLWVAILSLLRVVQLYSIILLAVKDTLLGPLTLSNIALTSVLSLGYVSPPGTLLGCGLALLSAVHLTSILPNPVGRHKWLLLMVAPFCAVAGILKFNDEMLRAHASGQPTSSELHPIEILVQKAQTHFSTMVRSQSKTLSEAVATYRKRYGRDPPLEFKKWFQMAQDADYVLIDEFDTIMDSLEPFWGVAPSVLREDVDLIGESAPAIVRISIENHQIKDKASHRGVYQANIIDRWLEKPGWLEMLPDMTLLVNRLDEPRVLAPFETLLAAKEAAMSDAGDGQFVQSISNAYWIDLARTESWRAMFSACPNNSLARDETSRQTPRDDEQSFSLPFISNLTSSQDVCQNPIISRSQGFFTSPASCSIIHSLIPIFSPAKPSNFNDILYPSIWYWIKLISKEYNEHDDMAWSDKKDILYWTGSATGGYATLENWPELHRQRLVLQMTRENASVRVLHRTDESSPKIVWQSHLMPWSNISHLFDLRITSVPSDQCTPEACAAMRNQFLKDPTYIDDSPTQDPNIHSSQAHNNPNADPLKAAYAAKYVLDLDGNAFSGRFYRLLASQSAVLKQSIFREWHDGRLVPWVHFIPISASGAELGETMRFFTQEEAGRRIGREIARDGREWARGTLRMVDLELTFLRVLMEYGRLFDEGRDGLGSAVEDSVNK